MIRLDNERQLVTVKIVFKSRTDRFARIELQEIHSDRKPRFVNPSILMGSAHEMTLTDGSVLKRHFSGGLYLDGRSHKGLEELLLAHGYGVNGREPKGA